MSEWFKVIDSNSIVCLIHTGGSNPSLSATHQSIPLSYQEHIICPILLIFMFSEGVQGNFSGHFMRPHKETIYDIMLLFG